MSPTSGNDVPWVLREGREDQVFCSYSLSCTCAVDPLVVMLYSVAYICSQDPEGGAALAVRRNSDARFSCILLPYTDT